MDSRSPAGRSSPATWPRAAWCGPRTRACASETRTTSWHRLTTSSCRRSSASATGCARCAASSPLPTASGSNRSGDLSAVAASPYRTALGEAPMFIRNRLSGLTLTAVLLCVLISACGGGSGPGSTPQIPTAQQPPTLPPPPTPPPTQPPPPTPPPPPVVVVASVSVTPENIGFAALGQTVQLTATALDANGQAVPSAAMRWASSNPAALEVSDTGLVTARANGAGTITAATAGAASDVTDSSQGSVEQVPVALSI